MIAQAMRAASAGA